MGQSHSHAEVTYLRSWLKMFTENCYIDSHERIDYLLKLRSIIRAKFPPEFVDASSDAVLLKEWDDAKKELA